jgi:hypothetical protein
MNAYSFPITRLLTGLAICATLPIPAASAAGPLDSRTQSAPINHRIPISPAKKLLNGIVEIDPQGKEFPLWLTSHSFYETPATIKARWTKNNTGTNYAKWVLVETGAKKTVASGTVKALTKPNGTANFDVDLGKVLPKYNESSADHVYELRVTSADPSVSSGKRFSVQATLTHKHRSSRRSAPAEDPYSCGYSADGYKRVVSLAIPEMTVHNTTNTSGENSDELFFQVARLGPKTASAQMRLPDAKTNYRAPTGATVDVFSWKNEDGKAVSSPVMWVGEMRHGETVTLVVNALEDDMDNLKDIKNGVIIAMEAVAKIAGSMPSNPYAAIVAAAAGVVASVNKGFVPDIDSDDMIGAFGVQFSNRCGRIQSRWVTYDTATVNGQTVSSSFLDTATHATLPARLTAMYAEDPKTKSGFSPTGWDYGEYTQVGESDAFMWRALGTSKANYTFVVLGMTAMPVKTRAG